MTQNRPSSKHPVQSDAPLPGRPVLRPSTALPRAASLLQPANPEKTVEPFDPRRRRTLRLIGNLRLPNCNATDDGVLSP
jgi:hypothetical protein